MSRALDDIAAERRRQTEQEGWTPDHDDEHSDGQLAAAAACYAMPPDYRDYGPEHLEMLAPQEWPWSEEWWKPTPSDRRRELVKAGRSSLRRSSGSTERAATRRRSEMGADL